MLVPPAAGGGGDPSTLGDVRNPALAFRPVPGTIPDAPGCYQFKDAHGRVVYVGKAKSLRARLSNYFQAWHAIPARTRAMLEAARSVEWIVVDTEVEALHLEYTLIQRHRPRYNVRYRDDKSYPYLVLTTSEQVPRARVQRGRIAKGDRRFGPYAHAYAIRETLDLLLRVFPVRTCSQGVYDRAERTGRPCLLHHIDRCAAPCTGVVGFDEHRALVDELAEETVHSMESNVAAGTYVPTEHPRERALVLLIWSLGAVTLHDHVRRLLGADLAGEPKALLPYLRGATELLTAGLFAPALHDNVRDAIARLEQE